MHHVSHTLRAIIKAQNFQKVVPRYWLAPPMLKRDPMGGSGQADKNLLTRRPKPCVVYGFGIADEPGFENEMAAEGYGFSSPIKSLFYSRWLSPLFVSLTTEFVVDVRFMVLIVQSRKHLKILKDGPLNHGVWEKRALKNSELLECTMKLTTDQQTLRNLNTKVWWK